MTRYACLLLSILPKIVSTLQTEYKALKESHNISKHFTTHSIYPSSNNRAKGRGGNTFLHLRRVSAKLEYADVSAKYWILRKSLNQEPNQSFLPHVFLGPKF
jgi:hypothetical protein